MRTTPNATRMRRCASASRCSRSPQATSAARRRTHASSCGRSPPCAELDYTVFVPAHAKDAAGSLPATEVGEAPLARRGPARVLGMALSAFRSRAVKTELETVDVVHYALTVPIPATKVPTVVTLHDVQHRDLPEFFGPARRSFRRIAYDRATRSASSVIVTSEFVRARALELLELDPARVHVIPHGVNHTLFRPGDEEREPFLLYPGASLAAQESRPAVRGVRDPSQDTAAAAPRPHGRRARTAGLAPGRRRALGGRPGRRAGVAVPAGGGHGLSEPVRGLRASAARGDGVGLPRRGVEYRGDPGGLRRCRRALRPARSGVDRERHPGRGRARATSSARRDSRGQPGSRGTRLPRLHEDVYLAAAAANE